MAAGSEKNGDFYAVLGLKKECSDSELRNAYKKLALKWHPDRCSALGKYDNANEAKEKFQAIQEAYSILSDSNKRFLYDMGIDENDDDENGMGDFLDEMAQMMSQAKSKVNGQDSFEDLQQLFVDIFQADLDLRGTSNGLSTAATTLSSSSNACCNPSVAVCSDSGGKRRGSALASAAGKAKLEELDASSTIFCYGLNDSMHPDGGGRGGGRRNGRKHKASSKHDLSSDTGISA